MKSSFDSLVEGSPLVGIWNGCSFRGSDQRKSCGKKKTCLGQHGEDGT
jgi:hypothetical protein